MAAKTLAGAPRLLLASYHCLLDSASGAARSLLDMLQMLAERGWNVRVFCGPRLDQTGKSTAELLAAGQCPAEVQSEVVGDRTVTVANTRAGSVPVTVVDCGDDHKPTAFAVNRYFESFQEVLEDWQPQILLTYGGQWVGDWLMRAARDRGIRVVFSLMNPAYHKADFFRYADVVRVPSQFAARHYRRKLGLHCEVLCSPIVWSRVQCDPDPHRRYVTFINPEGSKGAAVFAGIAAELSNSRPDIPMLVVEGRARASALLRYGADLSASNLHVLPNTPDPRDFFRQTKLLLMPSLWEEFFARSCVEAQINGIPVLVSDRGALPEVAGSAGFCFSIPREVTSQSVTPPSAEQLRPWIETIQQLWDNDDVWTQSSQRARAASWRFHDSQVADDCDRFFRQRL